MTRSWNAQDDTFRGPRGNRSTSYFDEDEIEFGNKGNASSYWRGKVNDDDYLDDEDDDYWGNKD